MERKADVIVVGAGLAGLKAARELVSSGRSVILLEANERVGGRLKRDVIDGRNVDSGGQWVGAGHSFLFDEAKRLGIEAYSQYATGKTLLQLVGKLTSFTGEVPRMPLLSLIEVFFLQRRWDREMATIPAESPWLAPRAKEWDTQTLETWIARNLRTKSGRAFARLVPRGAWAVDASQISYLWFLDALRSGTGLKYLMDVKGGALDSKFLGGMHQIAARLAEELGDRVVLGAPVQAITQSESGTKVTTAKGEFEGRFVIVATPPVSAARIKYEPALPAAREGLQSRMPMGNIIKINIAYAEPFWRKLGFSGQVATDEDTLGIVMDDTQPTGPAVLLAFIEGERAVRMSGFSQAERKGAVVASLVRFFGREAENPVGYVENDWNVEPYTYGYVGHMPPGVMTRFGHALREPCGRIHWAGTETSVEYQGYIEGAMRSGVRAAGEVMRRHNA
jgi:monoamine oxidase